MTNIKEILRVTIFATGLFTSLLGAASMYLTGPFLLVLSILKLVGAMPSTPWFGYPAVLSIIGTPFWMVLIGLGILLLAMVLMAIATETKQ